MSKPIVTRDQIRTSYESEGNYGPILSTEQVAALLGRSVKTVYEWIAMGHLDGSFRKRGKRHLFWRDRVIDIVLNGTEWPPLPRSNDQKAQRNSAIRGRAQAPPASSAERHP